MTQKKLILVTGATGAQGGSVANALLLQKDFSVRILTRNASSANALALKTKGAEVAVGDLDDIESLKKAMAGCHGVFGLTNFWEHFGKEYSQGKNLIDAVAATNIKHFVLHTLTDYGKLSGGKFPVPHCDGKAALQVYCDSLGLPATYVQLAFYYENFLNFFPLQHGADDNWHFGFPQGDTKLAMASVEDLGEVVASIFNDPQTYIGRTVGVVAEDETCSSYAETMTSVFARRVVYNHIPRDVYAGFGFPGAEELANMFEVQRLYILNRQADKEESHRLNPGIQSFRSWLVKNKDQFASQFNVTQAAEAVGV